MGVARRKKRSPTEERGGFSLPKKSKSRGDWMQDHAAEEKGFTTPKKHKSRGGWTTEHPAEHKGYTTPQKSKSRGGWTTEHPAEHKGYKTPQTSKSRGGWTTEHPEEFFPPKAYKFSGSPYSRSTKIHSFGSGSHTPSYPPSYKSSKVWTGHEGTPVSQGSAWSNHHRFSASRFGNSSTGGHGRNYSRW